MNVSAYSINSSSIIFIVIANVKHDIGGCGWPWGTDVANATTITSASTPIASTCLQFASWYKSGVIIGCRSQSAKVSLISFLRLKVKWIIITWYHCIRCGRWLSSSLKLTCLRKSHDVIFGTFCQVWILVYKLIFLLHQTNVFAKDWEQAKYHEAVQEIGH